MKIVNKKDVDLTQRWLWQRLPKSHPFLHYLAGFCQDQDFAIIDIETLGLSERPIILLGIAKIDGDRICTSQFLLRDIPDEPGAIWALVSQLEPKSSLISYNGRSFDIPYIKQRLAYYGLDSALENTHFDLLHFAKRALRPKLSDCRLDTVEKYIGIRRDSNIPGTLVPQFYETYLKTKNVGPLVPIVEHNKQDLLTLGSLFSKHLTFLGKDRLDIFQLLPTALTHLLPDLSRPSPTFPNLIQPHPKTIPKPKPKKQLKTNPPNFWCSKKTSCRHKQTFNLDYF
jgi:uncharacterized protein YprB with RNaseH-like and TPR domain